MSRIGETTAEQEAKWHAWVAARPPHVRVVAERFNPWSLYRMESTGHRIVVKGFDEQESGEVTVRVLVLAAFNLVEFEREVFGIDPDDLKPCDPPGPDEVVGALMTQDEAREFIARGGIKPSPS